ncbi:TetR/AcrR family transcriptional regulator [Peredibacter starrii]|uniref:TetR/AcrR family transcriptional regulator n=1 Tax=Peredibacter starrii TaxID=28202 RepID=A0AAX4HK20_9BACT|nr:TetR/AcrR family transcriptional regulator [Peredibacter starrii]WPU63573.1 TetR/AcrR family transcriptional regulator [Peredibacter starrii]
MAKAYHHGDLKEATINQALLLIEERSSIQFTLREVATKLNVSHTAIYRHFQSRLDLLSSIAEIGFNKLNELFEINSEGNQNKKKQLHNLCLIYMEFSIDHPEYYRCMFNPELKCGDESLTESLNQASAKTFQYLLQALGSSEARANSVWASLHGFCDLNLNGQLFHKKMSKKETENAFADHITFILR